MFAFGDGQKRDFAPGSENMDLQLKCGGGAVDNSIDLNNKVFSPLRKTSGSRPLRDVFFFKTGRSDSQSTRRAKIGDSSLLQAPQADIIELARVVERATVRIVKSPCSSQ